MSRVGGAWLGDGLRGRRTGRWRGRDWTETSLPRGFSQPSTRPGPRDCPSVCLALAPTRPWGEGSLAPTQSSPGWVGALTPQPVQCPPSQWLVKSQSEFGQQLISSQSVPGEYSPFLHRSNFSSKLKGWPVSSGLTQSRFACSGTCPEQEWHGPSRVRDRRTCRACSGGMSQHCCAWSHFPGSQHLWVSINT